MARFNPKKVEQTKVINRAGGQAYKQSDKLEVVSMLLTNMVQDQYYRRSAEAVQRMAELVQGLPDKKFLAKAGIFARTKYGMRSITHVLAGELVNKVKGQEWMKNFLERVIYRPDDMTEILSYYMSTYGKPIPNSLKKGLSLAFKKFNEYNIAKYRGEGKAMKMVDLINLITGSKHKKGFCHPQGNEIAFKLLTGQLKPADTWEVGLTKAGQVAEDDEQKVELKNAAWKSLIDSNKLGYFALLRNLRNIKEQAPDSLDKALEMLVDEKAIKKSLVFPFRFLTAYDEIKNDRKIVAALDKAADIALNNVPEFQGKTLIVLDESGSMTSAACGNTTAHRIGALFASVLWKRNPNSDLLTFANSARYISDERLAILPTMEISRTLEKKMKGGGTDFHSIFKVANKSYDRVIILSDMQGWIGYDSPKESFDYYCKRFNCKPLIYSFDLAGYGDMQFPEQNVFCLAGFSDKVFQVMKMLETDKNALIKEIEKVEL